MCCVSICPRRFCPLITVLAIYLNSNACVERLANGHVPFNRHWHRTQRKVYDYNAPLLYFHSTLKLLDVFGHCCVLSMKILSYSLNFLFIHEGNDSN